MDAYSSFTRNYQSLEATKMSFSKWTDILWYIQVFYTALKKKKSKPKTKKTHEDMEETYVLFKLKCLSTVSFQVYDILEMVKYENRKITDC